MPIFQKYIDDNSTVLCWKHEEDEVLSDELIFAEDFNKVSQYHPKKLLEYKMVRKMLKEILPDHKILYKAIGQPYLQPKSYFISISHSYPYAALAVSKKRIGIDFEKSTPKFLRVKHKFLHETETEWILGENEVENLTVIWAIKEALYKLHPCKFWSLKKFYIVEPFDLNDLSMVKCKVFDDDFEDCYIANVKKFDEYYFAMIEEDHQINYKIPRETPS